ELERLRVRADACSAELSSLRASKELSEATHAERASELAQLRPQRAGLAKAVEEVRNTVQLKRNRLKVLSDLHRRLEGVGAGTKALLSFSDPAVLGILADRVEVTPRFTEALAGLLGDRLQCV